MKKLLYISAVGLSLAALSACESEPKNPGDFSVKSELTVVDIKSQTTGDVYPLVVARLVDTTYHYYYNVNDTLKDAAGVPVLGPDGNLQITTEEKFYLSKKTAKLTEFEPVIFPSFTDVPYDTLAMNLTSNAAWEAPDPKTAVSWYANVNSSQRGGGDGTIYFSVRQFANKMSKYVVTQDVFTRDSMQMYRFTFRHTGLLYTGEE